jgi:hypothetical protein
MTSFIERIREGLSGKFKGLSNGLDRVNTYLFGIQRGCYILLGGLSGSAKTTFVDFSLINALKDAEDNKIPINVFYYSLEIDDITKKANWLSVIIYKKYGVIVQPEKIKGLGKHRLNDEDLKLVEDTIPELELLWGKINWVFEPSNPTGIYKALWDHFEKRGTFIKEPYINEHGIKCERIVKYINNNPEEYNILVVDHLA